MVVPYLVAPQNKNNLQNNYYLLSVCIMRLQSVSNSFDEITIHYFVLNNNKKWVKLKRVLKRQLFDEFCELNVIHSTWIRSARSSRKIDRVHRRSITERAQSSQCQIAHQTASSTPLVSRDHNKENKRSTNPTITSKPRLKPRPRFLISKRS